MAAEKNGLIGFEENDRLVTHGLKLTPVQMIMGAGHTDTAIIKRSGQMTVAILCDYQNLRGITGMRQQADILPSISGGNESSGMVIENIVAEADVRGAHGMDCHYCGGSIPQWCVNLE